MWRYTVFPHAFVLKAAVGLERDLTGQGCGVDLLAYSYAAPKAPLPPPYGVDTGEVLPYQHRRLLGQELVEIVGHAPILQQHQDG